MKNNFSEPFDYKEPSCALCGGKEFYNPELSHSKGNIPIDRIIRKLDSYFSRNDLKNAEILLKYWQTEAENLEDKKGELSILNELIGLYRKTENKTDGYEIIKKSLKIIKELDIEDYLSAATVYLNIATAYKCFSDLNLSQEFYKKCEKIYEKNHAQEEDFAGLYNNYATLLQELKQYDESEKLFTRAIKLLEGKNKELDQAISYVNLAHLYYEINENDKITDSLFIAYNLINSENTEKNGYYAYVLDKCAPSFEFFGYNKIAEELKKESQEIYERS